MSPKSSSTFKEAMCRMDAFLGKRTDHEDDIIDDNNNSNCSNQTNANMLLLDTDATECSSSFETTTSDALDASGISDAEVESTSLDTFIYPRKKKVTKHWRQYICPLVWRCKWTELRMIEIESQGMNLARELGIYDKQKLWESDPDAVESIGSRSYPYFRQYPRNKVMKRRMRRKVEDSIDVASYISQHNLFSFMENKKRDLDGFTTAVDVVNRVHTNKNTHGYNQFGKCDAHSFVAKDWNTGVEGIFEKLERVQSRVHKFKTQLQNVISEHAANFSSSEDLSLLAPFDGQFSSNDSPNLSVGEIFPSIQSISDFDMADLGIPDSEVSRFGESIDMDGIIESTVAVLPAADAPSSHLEIMNTDQKMDDDIPVETPFVEPQRLGMISTEVPNEQPSEEPENAPSVPHEPSSLLESSFVSDFTPKNKKKRGERKVSSGSWIKRYSIGDSE